MSDLRRVGAHYVKVGGTTLHQAIVEIEDGRVVNYYEFEDELPLTEWLGDTIEIRRSADGVLQAWWKGGQKEYLLLE
jgi:hypothetical protein